MIAGGVALREVLDELCRTIDVVTPGVVSTVLLMDPDGKRLWPGGGPAFPEALRPAINPWRIGPDRGACGRAAFLKERVIIADVTTDPRWPDQDRELAVSHGLRASWSQPLITSAGTVLAPFAMSLRGAAGAGAGRSPVDSKPRARSPASRSSSNNRRRRCARARDASASS